VFKHKNTALVLQMGLLQRWLNLNWEKALLIN